MVSVEVQGWVSYASGALWVGRAELSPGERVLARDGQGLVMVEAEKLGR